MRVLLLLLLTAAAAEAQYQPGFVPNPTPLNYLPNYYNRANQPLSPYLNMMRGINPGVNYYYGVRPGTPAGGVNVFGQAPLYQPFVGANAGGFLPQAQVPADAVSDTYEPGGRPIVLRSAAHPVLYGNQFNTHGSFSSVYAWGNRGMMPSGPQRSSAQGVGTLPRR